MISDMIMAFLAVSAFNFIPLILSIFAPEDTAVASFDIVGDTVGDTVVLIVVTLVVFPVFLTGFVNDPGIGCFFAVGALCQLVVFTCSIMIVPQGYVSSLTCFCSSPLAIEWRIVVSETTFIML